MSSMSNDYWTHRTPQDLSINEPKVSRILVVGSCFSESIVPHYIAAFPDTHIDYIPYNFSGELPEMPPSPIEEYAFQLIVLPMRSITPEQLTMRLKYHDSNAYESAFLESEQRLVQLLDGALDYQRSNKLLTFVANFLVPQQNSMGRMMPRYDLRNPMHYVEKLNEIIASEIVNKENTYLLDFDSIAASIGKKYVQDDGLWIHAHGTCIYDWDYQFDQQRLEIPAPYSAQYEVKSDQFYTLIWHELRAMYKSVAQIDSVKLVIIDLDDTLWRGIVAEEGIRYAAVEGYPLGLIEALLFLKRRGILLAIASKNDDARISEIWDGFIGGYIPLSDFAVKKINWQPKVENIHEILAETNLLAKNVIFIDDNPVERAAVREAFPEMRILGDDIYRLRRVLLWSGETQVTHITDESGRRTEMIQAQIQREGARSKMSREEFLQSLQICVKAYKIISTNDERFARAFELINKSNQFNTNGKRWTYDEFSRAFQSGSVIKVAHVTDKYTDYGIVAVAVIRDSSIEQYVMSCRVFGLGIEQALLTEITTEIHEYSDAFANVIETSANALGREVYLKCGFTEINPGEWILQQGNPMKKPEHVNFAMAMS